MNDFKGYLLLGYEHIVNLAALDHILFIIAFMAPYMTKHWVKILIGLSLFTLGHSITLSLSALDFIKVNKAWVEFLIPLTIVITALLNLTKAGQDPKNKLKTWIALLFGLIHGLGFSNYYQMLVLGEGKGQYWTALIPFNLGIELGQLLIGTVLLLAMVVHQYMLNKKAKDWNLFVSGVAFGLALIMCIRQWPL